MGSIAVNGVGTKNKNLVRRLSRLSFDAEGFAESKDWPYLWPKAKAVSAREKVLATKEKPAEVKAQTKRLATMYVWGIASVAMYLALFINQGAITKYFTQGGFFSLAVVPTALAFALVHGTFAGHVLAKMNFNAANRRKDDH